MDRLFKLTLCRRRDFLIEHCHGNCSVRNGPTLALLLFQIDSDEHRSVSLNGDSFSRDLESLIPVGLDLQCVVSRSEIAQLEPSLLIRVNRRLVATQYFKRDLYRFRDRRTVWQHDRATNTRLAPQGQSARR